MLTYLKSLLPPLPPIFGEKEEKEMFRHAVTRVSSGSVLVQSGNYLTKQNVQKRKQALLKRRR